MLVDRAIFQVSTNFSATKYSGPEEADKAARSVLAKQRGNSRRARFLRVLNSFTATSSGLPKEPLGDAHSAFFTICSDACCGLRNRCTGATALRVCAANVVAQFSGLFTDFDGVCYEVFNFFVAKDGLCCCIKEPKTKCSKFEELLY